MKRLSRILSETLSMLSGQILRSDPSEKRIIQNLLVIFLYSLSHSSNTCWAPVRCQALFSALGMQHWTKEPCPHLEALQVVLEQREGTGARKNPIVGSTREVQVIGKVLRGRRTAAHWRWCDSLVITVTQKTELWEVSSVRVQQRRK